MGRGRGAQKVAGWPPGILTRIDPPSHPVNRFVTVRQLRGEQRLGYTTPPLKSTRAWEILPPMQFLASPSAFVDPPAVLQAACYPPRFLRARRRHHSSRAHRSPQAQNLLPTEPAASHAPRVRSPRLTPPSPMPKSWRTIGSDGKRRFRFLRFTAWAHSEPWAPSLVCRSLPRSCSAANSSKAGWPSYEGMRPALFQLCLNAARKQPQEASHRHASASVHLAVPAGHNPGPRASGCRALPPKRMRLHGSK